MMSDHPALSYQQAAARGASPVGQIVALYDTILRDFVRALATLQAGDVETRVFELNHALLVIAYLQNALDHGRGGEAAKQFEQFYAITRGMIVEANIRATPESLEKLIDLYGGLRQAWYQAEQQLPVDWRPAPSSAQADGAAETHDVRPAFEDVEMPQSHWNV